MFEPSPKQHRVLQILAWMTGLFVAFGGGTALHLWIGDWAVSVDYFWMLIVAWLAFLLVAMIIAEHSYKLYVSVLEKLEDSKDGPIR